MKNENTMLIKFIAIMGASMAAGVICGRLALPLAAGNIFFPQALVLGPVLVGLSAFFLIVNRHSRRYHKLQHICVLCFTGLGVTLSGCCGFYTLGDVPVIVCTAVMAVVVMLAALYRQSADTGKIHSRKIRHTDKEKLTAVLFFAVMGLSLFVPLGPVPVLAAGIGWRTVIKRG